MQEPATSASQTTALNTCIACNRRLCSFLPTGAHAPTPTGIHLTRGERLETKGGACLRFWVVIGGTAAICTSFPDGRRQIIALETTGDTVCGPMSTQDSTIWLEALDDCMICQLDFSPYAAELGQNPAFMMAMFSVVHHSLERSTNHLSTLGRLDSTERVLLFLGEMALRRSGDGSASVNLPMSREDIADYLGLNAETVSRILSRLKKSGLVRFHSRTEYVLPDLAQVERRLPVAIPRKRSGHFTGFTPDPQSHQERAG